MATINQWKNRITADEKIMHQDIMPTPDKYAQIKNLGLETVFWEEYTSEEFSSQQMLRAKEFIDKSSPCLFICDPRTKETGLKKLALFDIYNIEQVAEWTEKNKDDLKKYNYLVTSQITNPGNGFVGSVKSNGKGQLWCETLHYPKVCNQRELSQPSKNYEGCINELFIDVDSPSEIWAVTTALLTKQNILDIKHIYLHREGYFEFVKGTQHGQNGIYTTGYESGWIFAFDRQIHETGCRDISFRTKGAILRESY